MQRSLWLTSIVLLLVALPSPCLRAAEPSNLLIIQTDEHHFGTLGCYGGKVVDTQHIDWLARQGALCTSFYATTPVCSPSRAAFVSGKYPQKTPVTNNNIPLDDSIITFAAVLRRRGYATGYAGKWHLDGRGKPQWAPKRQFGFADNRFMFNRGHWKKLIDTPTGPQVGARNAKGQPTYGLDGANQQTYTTDWLTTKAIDFIDTHSAQPFCYYLSIPDPHGPNKVRAPYDTMYDDVEIPIPASLKSAGRSPAWGNSAGVTAAQLRRLMPDYYGMVKCIDDNVGRLLDKLREKQIVDRTIVVFTSDHGDLCGEHGRLNKGVPYEGSARIPFIMYAPGKIKPGMVRREALSSVDFMPTVLRLMHVLPDHEMDGRNAAGLFTGREKQWDDVAFIRSTSGSKPWLSAVTERYKLVYSSVEEPWLIDMKTDPRELTNAFAEEDSREIVTDLTRKLQAYAQEHHDEYARVPEIRAAMLKVLGE